MAAAPTASSIAGWVFDVGTAQSMARSQNKNILVFFVADGNKNVAKYETELFTSPAVQAALNNFVLLKINFPRNTRQGYKLGIFGSGMIAITNSTSDPLLTITSIPTTADELATSLTATLVPTGKK